MLLRKQMELKMVNSLVSGAVPSFVEFMGWPNWSLPTLQFAATTMTASIIKNWVGHFGKVFVGVFGSIALPDEMPIPLYQACTGLDRRSNASSVTGFEPLTTCTQDDEV